MHQKWTYPLLPRCALDAGGGARGGAGPRAKRIRTAAPPPEAVRASTQSRATKETSIEVKLELDAPQARVAIDTGLKTLDSMLGSLVKKVPALSLDLRCRGDTHIDDHHSAEDVAIALGQCINAALGSKAGCTRMGFHEAGAAGAKVTVVMDLSNRPHFEHNLDFGPHEMADDVSCEMVVHALDSLSTAARMTVHVLYEAAADASELEPSSLACLVCEAWGAAFAACCAIDPRRRGSVTSSKGTLSA